MDMLVLADLSFGLICISVSLTKFCPSKDFTGSSLFAAQWSEYVQLDLCSKITSLILQGRMTCKPKHV